MSIPVEAGEAPGAAPFPDMVWTLGGTFLMGSDQHYPEERPAHRVTLDGFWMDRAPVTNRAEYSWGSELTPGGRFMANYWQGNFRGRT